MELNPYAKFLGDRDPLEVVASTPAQLARLISAMPAGHAELSPDPGRWSPREIVAHLADCELVFCFRLRQTLAEDHPILQPFDQDKWAARYANHSLAASLRMFEAARNWNLLLLAPSTAADRASPVSHPERGTMTLWTIVETMAGHDLNHLAQLDRMA